MSSAFIQRIIDDVRDHDPVTVAEHLAALARGERIEVDDATLRLAWLVLVREPTAFTTVLVTNTLALALLQTGDVPWEEYLADRSIFDAGPGYVRGETYHAPQLVYAANFHEGIEEVGGPSLAALVHMTLHFALGRGDGTPPEHASPEVIGWILGDFPRATAVQCLRAGRLLSALGRDEEAIDLLEHGVALDGASWEIEEQLGNLRLDRGEREKARVLFERALHRDGCPRTNLLNNLGRAHAELGNSDEALLRLNEALELDPDLTSALLIRSHVLSAQLSRPADAAADLDRVVELAPDAAQPHYLRGNNRAALKDFDGAVADYDRAIELAPDHQYALANRGKLHQERGEQDKALADFTRSIEAQPTAQALSGRAHALAQQGDVKGAIANLSWALSLQPSIELYAQRARLFAQAGPRWRAVSDYVSVVRRSGQRDEWVNQALEALPLHEYAGPIEYPFPENLEVMIQQASTLETSEPNRARGLYERALELDPGHVDALYNLGSFHLAEGSTDLALALLSRAIEVNPGDTQAHLNRGTALFAEGVSSGQESLFSQASEAFRTAIDLSPQYPAGYLKLGTMEAMTSRKWNGLVLLMIAATLQGPDHPLHEHSVAQVQTLLNDPELLPEDAPEYVGTLLRGQLRARNLTVVLTVGEQLLHTLPEHPTILAHVGVAFWLAEHDDEAWAYLGRARAADAPLTDRALDECIAEWPTAIQQAFAAFQAST